MHQSFIPSGQWEDVVAVISALSPRKKVVCFSCGGKVSSLV